MLNLTSLQLGKEPSKIRELFEYAKTRKKEIGSNNVFDFSIGNPSVESPKIVNDTLIDLIKNIDSTKLHGYTSAQGDLEVRASISNYLNEKYNTNTNPNLIYMTCGAAASLTISLNAIISNPTDEIIVFAPFFPEYKVFVENAKGKLVVVEPTLPTFLPNLNDLKNKISNNTKAVIINSPNNPTGVLLKEDIIKEISKILKEKENIYNHNIYLISDEPYRELVYTNDKYPFITNYYDNSIICYSFSKSLSLPGERIGYIIVNNNCNIKEDLYKAICGSGRKLGFVCAPALFQYMIPNTLGHTSNLDIYKENRDILYNNLIKYGYEVVYPDGAFYLFVKSPINDSNIFSELAKKYELILVPSDSFGYKGYLRLSYCVDKKMIEKSLLSFEKLIKEVSLNE
jgi:aspartate aminotransferase